MPHASSISESNAAHRSRVADFLVHKEGDSVAVAVRDVTPGVSLVAYMDSGRELQITVIESIPLGHKVSLGDFGGGDKLIEYGVRVGLATMNIQRGQLVHVHNIRSARWTNGS